MFVSVYSAVRENCLTLLQSRSQQHCGLRQVFRAQLDKQTWLRQWRFRPPTQSRKCSIDLQLLLQARAYLLVPAHQALWYTSLSGSQTQELENIQMCKEKKKQSRQPCNLWIFWIRASAARFSSSDSLVYSSSSSGQLSRENSNIKLLYKWWTAMSSKSSSVFLYTPTHCTQINHSMKTSDRPS